MTQPERLAMLRGGNRLHKIKERYPDGTTPQGNIVARCGMEAYWDEYWQFDPPAPAKKAKDGPVLCAYCHGEGDERSKEWDTL